MVERLVDRILSCLFSEQKHVYSYRYVRRCSCAHMPALRAGISLWDAGSIESAPQQIREEIDRLGAESGVAQDLREPITSAQKLGASDHRLYLQCDERGVPTGFIKVGTKHLFYMTSCGAYVELDPLCVLDFYVCGTQQRRGLGIALFRIMLEREGGPEPKDLAYDRPSPKLLPFLRKHFGLSDFFEQPNRYVVFDSHSRLASA